MIIYSLLWYSLILKSFLTSFRGFRLPTAHCSLSRPPSFPKRPNGWRRDGGAPNTRGQQLAATEQPCTGHNLQAGLCFLLICFMERTSTSLFVLKSFGSVIQSYRNQCEPVIKPWLTRDPLILRFGPLPSWSVNDFLHCLGMVLICNDRKLKPKTVKILWYCLRQEHLAYEPVRWSWAVAAVLSLRNVARTLGCCRVLSTVQQAALKVCRAAYPQTSS